MGAERDLKITSIIERLNRVIANTILSTRFVSLFFGELDTNGSLFYILTKTLLDRATEILAGT